MQEAYVRAYEHLAQFEGRAQFSTWLTRIAVNEALKRLSARGRLDPLNEERYEEEDGGMQAFHSTSPSPESNASNSELKSSAGGGNTHSASNVSSSNGSSRC